MSNDDSGTISKLPWAFTIKGDTIKIGLKRQEIEVTDFLALLRYMEQHTELKKIVFEGSGGYLQVNKDY